METPPVDLLRVERSIRLIRGDKVILDEDLAELYGVENKQLIRAVKRNLDRFPADFMFQLTNQEFTILRCQFGTSSQWGGRRTPPYAFSEQGGRSLVRGPRSLVREGRKVPSPWSEQDERSLIPGPWSKAFKRP